MKKYYNYKTKIGYLHIMEEDGKIVKIDFGYKEEKQFINEKSITISETIKQLEEYFHRQRKYFDIPIKLYGTGFQLKVWEEIRKIPYGATISYKELARKTGDEKAARAVGYANNKNPIPIIVPCHRVIGKNGDLGGYSGGRETKQNLLELEGFYGII
jgi:methylated-DNA-[protein]-cysteine S-methyltransferase